MSFLLILLCAVPVYSILGFLSLPLRWLSSRSASIVGAFVSWASAVLDLRLGVGGGGQAKVVSARLNLNHGTIYVKLCNFLSSVSLQQKFAVDGQTSGIAQFWQARKYISGMRVD